MEAEQVKHLEFIQAVITRMNTNSFQIKTWCISVVAGFLAVYAASKIPLMIALAIPPTLVFWLLDTYYLTQERKFRGLYDDVAGVSKEPKKIEMFAMRPDFYKGGKYSFPKVFISVSIWPLYLPTILSMAIAFLFALKSDC